ncbi:MAG TPA: GGDEF domain-containing protein [Acidothermaceae bacterium]
MTRLGYSVCRIFLDFVLRASWSTQERACRARGILTFSAGLAILEGGSKRPGADVLLDADQALYRAKALGRNRIECFDPDQTTTRSTTTKPTTDELLTTELETEVVTELVAGVTELVTEVNGLVTNQLATPMAGTKLPA